jgi:CBS domain containing-hemolysin-like protein
MTALKLLVVIVLVVINGFVVAAEFAMVGVRRSRIATLAASGDRAATRLLSLLNNLNAYLSASQLGITLASLALGWVGEPTVARCIAASALCSQYGSLEAVLRQMQRAKAHFGFVVDEHGGLEGIITLEDLLEEIVGDISDEHDEEVNEQITQVADREYILAGGLAVRDFNRRLKLNVTESEAYTTIAGFLMTQAGHVLSPGEIIEHNGLTFEIDRVERRRVISVCLKLPTDLTAPQTLETAEGARAGG